MFLTLNNLLLFNLQFAFATVDAAAPENINPQPEPEVRLAAPATATSCPSSWISQPKAPSGQLGECILLAIVLLMCNTNVCYACPNK